MKELIYIFLGGGTGSVLRYYVQELLHERIIPYSFPWATFTVNIFGSFLIGLFYTLSARFNLSPEVRLLLTAGFCGGCRIKVVHSTRFSVPDIQPVGMGVEVIDVKAILIQKRCCQSCTVVLRLLVLIVVRR